MSRAETFCYVPLHLDYWNTLFFCFTQLLRLIDLFLLETSEHCRPGFNILVLISFWQRTFEPILDLYTSHDLAVCSMYFVYSCYTVNVLVLVTVYSFQFTINAALLTVDFPRFFWPVFLPIEISNAWNSLPEPWSWCISKQISRHTGRPCTRARYQMHHQCYLPLIHYFSTLSTAISFVLLLA